MLTLLWSALTRVSATALLANASALRTTRELPVSALCAPMLAVRLVCASLRSSSPPRLLALTPLLGTPESTLAASAILAAVVLTAHWWSAPLEVTFLRVMAMRRVATARAAESVTTPTEPANALWDTTERDASTRPSWVNFVSRKCYLCRSSFSAVVSALKICTNLINKSHY